MANFLLWQIKISKNGCNLGKSHKFWVLKDHIWAIDACGVSTHNDERNHKDLERDTAEQTSNQDQTHIFQLS